MMITLILIPASAGDICTKLNTNDGSGAFKVQDKDSNLLFSVDSKGINPSVRITAASADGGQLEWRSTGVTRHFNLDQVQDGTAPRFRIFTEDDLLDANGLELLTIRNNGNVGIGVPTPNTSLEISFDSPNSTLTGRTAYGGLHFKQSTTADDFVGITTSATDSGTQGGILFQGSGAYGTKIHFLTTNIYTSGMQDRMVIDHLGNVGIGSISPSSALEINRTAATPMLTMYSNRLSDSSVMENRILFGGQTNSGWSTPNGAGIDFHVSYPAAGANASLNLWAYPQTTASPSLTINGGNVGVGRTPTYKLDVNGRIAARCTGASGWGGTYLGLFADVGDLPGYPTSIYQVIKTDGSYIGFSIGGLYSSYIDVNGYYTRVSSRTMKENIMQTDYQQILNKLETLEVSKWNFTSGSDSVKHIGPFAEDFYATFGLNGTNETKISDGDLSGIALAGIKGLIERVKKLNREVSDLKADNEALRKGIEEQKQDHELFATLQKRLDALEVKSK